MTIRKRLLFSAIAILILSLPLLLYIVRQQQEIRQRAAGGAVSLILSPASLTKAVGESFDAQLTLNGSDNNVTSVDVTVSFGTDVLEAISFAPASTFNATFRRIIDNQRGTIRYTAVSQPELGVTPVPITGSSIPLGTISFRAKAPGSSAVTFSDIEITASGLRTALPVQDNVQGSYTVTPSQGTTPSPTAEPTATPSPTGEPTLTPTPTTIPSPSPTQPAATSTPIPPTPTPCPGCVTFDVQVKLAGIGADGTTSPKRLERTLTVTLVDENDVETITKSGTVSFDVPTRMFVGAIDMGTVAPGVYTVKAASPGFMRKIIANIVDITQGVNRYQITASVALPAGDIRADNELNITDYHLFIDCFGEKANTLRCGSNKPFADITDDGVVDLVDYKYFFEGFATQRGD